jgi:hypothetical protein
MVKALIDISDGANRMLSILKAEYGLKDKSEAIDVMAKEYEALVFEPKLKPSYLRKLKNIEKEKIISLGSAKNFGKKYSD